MFLPDTGSLSFIKDKRRWAIIWMREAMDTVIIPCMIYVKKIARTAYVLLVAHKGILVVEKSICAVTTSI